VAERTEQVPAVDSLTVVIPNWETADYTVKSAQALIADGVPANRIVVVENGSGDDSPARLARALPDCRLVTLEQNIGYARAANAGAKALEGGAYLVVNNDAFVRRGSIARMLAALARDRTGIVVPRLLNDDDTLQATVKPLDTPGVALVRASGLSRFIPNRWQPRWSTHWDHATSRPIRAADGAVLLVRADAWNALGGFSRNTYMYAEDTDICWRAVELGWTVWFESDAEFVHLGNATASRRWSNPERAERWSSSEAHLVRERLSPPAGVLSILITAAGLAARAALFRLTGQRERSANHLAQLRGYLSALRPAPR
jgi:N-acetylglucosaminyl-diphospho-decaprenol L-rhamnosyltransferase